MGHLDRRELPNADQARSVSLPLGFRLTVKSDLRSLLFESVRVVFELNNAPDSSAQQTVIFLRVFLRNGNAAEAQV